MTRKKNYKPGDVVWTRGLEFGAWYECTVIEDPDTTGDPPGTFLLRSPAHGYAIYRHWSEMEKSPT